jgi:hypothetical protein
MKMLQTIKIIADTEQTGMPYSIRSLSRQLFEDIQRLLPLMSSYNILAPLVLTVLAEILLSIPHQLGVSGIHTTHPTGFPQLSQNRLFTASGLPQNAQNRELGAGCAAGRVAG